MKERQELLDYVTLMNGARLYLLPLTQQDLQLKRAEAEKEFTPREVEMPWYWTVEPDEKGQGGERVLWTKKDVEKDGTDEEKAAWVAYERNQFEKSTFVEDVVFKFILTDGTSRLVTSQGNEVDLIIDPVTFTWQPPEAWLKRLHPELVEGQNGSTPTDPAELKYRFLSPMIRDAETGRKIVSRCNLLSMRGLVTEEDLEKYDSIFRRAMAEAARDAGAEIGEPESGDEPGEEAALELFLPQAGNEGNEGVGQDTKQVGQPE